jgi:cytochrome c553
VLIVFIAASMIAAGARPPTGKPARPRRKEVCAACHGEDGNSAIADNPRLAGQHADYLAKGAARLQVGDAQERHHGRLRGGVIDKRHRESRSVLRVPTAVLTTRH